MPHGTPDWGLVGPKATTYGLDDLGEQAVRLKSPHLYDRRGDALYLTDFRGGRDCWLDTSVAGGHAIDLMTGHSRQGVYSLRLTAGDAPECDCTIYSYQAPPALSLIGFEFSFSVDGDTQFVDNDICYYDGTRHWRAILRYDVINQRVLYWDGVLGWQLLQAAVRLEGLEMPIHVLKLVFDMTLHTYVRGIVDDTEYNLNGLPMQNVGAVAPNYITFEVTLIGVGANMGEIYVDNCIITHNEPPWEG